MINVSGSRNAPRVSVIICTYNRREFLPEALRSALAQDYPNLEVILVNDGGEDVADIVEAMGDPRVTLHQRDENKGKAASLNEAIGLSSGKYICYLDDDDVHYPNHVRTLVDALERNPEYHLAYTDLYQMMLREEPDGSTRVLSKHVSIGRDFDRYFEFYINQALHVSLMHTREILDRTGMYNEKVRVMIEWDLNRRIAFYSDFLHVPAVTGEFRVIVNKNDRISTRERKDQDKYLHNTLRIKTARPPKPWAKVPDLSILLAPPHLDATVINQLKGIWRYGFMPYQVYLTLPEYEHEAISSAMPNVVPVNVPADMPHSERVDAALARCDGDYVAVIPGGLGVGDMLIERPLHAMIRANDPNQAFRIPGCRPDRWSALMNRQTLLRARRERPDLTVRRSVQAAGVRVRNPEFEELPFQFDELLRQAYQAESDGRWADAARVYGECRRRYGSDHWMNRQTIHALYELGGSMDDKAMELCRSVNEQRPTPATLLLEAKLHRRADRMGEALQRLQQAKEILDWKVVT
mgnify:CR=1 FL=1